MHRARPRGGHQHRPRPPGPACRGGRAAPRSRTTPRVSPYMLYRLARRYDEFPGRGRRGLVAAGRLQGLVPPRRRARATSGRSSTWRPSPTSTTTATWPAGATRPLGAFYRVNPYRLDDVQSAITELYAIAVSAVIHDGWARPSSSARGSGTLHVIQRPVDAQVGRRPRVRPRRLQRGRLPRPELVGHGLGQGRLRDAALRGLVRLRLRRVGGPAGRAPHPVLLGSQPDQRGNRRRARRRAPARTSGGWRCTS